jgi:exopolysaccharide biosynthesis polyprenyl glycosylphosphotransferase
MSRSRFIAFSLLVDALAFNGAVVAAFELRFWFRVPAFNFDPYLRIAPGLTVAFLLCAYVYGLYDPERIEGAWLIVRAAASSATLSTLITLGFLQLAGSSFDAFPRLVILLAAPLQFAVLVGWRVLSARITPVRWPQQRVLLVGTGSLAVELAAELTRRAKWGYRVAGLVAVDDQEATRPALPGAPPVLGSVIDLASIVRDNSIDRVIVASPVALRELVEDITLGGEADVRVDVVPELYEIFIGEVDSIVADIPLMEITHRSPQWYVGVKRVTDVLGALVLVLVLSPVFLLVALAVLVSMGLPVTFRQERLGRDRRPFTLYKFRTMVRDAEALSGPVLAEDEDPRITPLGRFLRKYRFDELPQLVNILRGEMSFVGPRPERAFFVERHLAQIPAYRERFRIKPGATGLAQVSGGYATTPERKLKYDLIYMYHQSLLMDVRIVADTIRVVLTGRGAR